MQDNTQWGCFDAEKPGWVGSTGGLRCRFRCHVPPVPVLGWNVKGGWEGGGREMQIAAGRGEDAEGGGIRKQAEQKLDWFSHSRYGNVGGGTEGVSAHRGRAIAMVAEEGTCERGRLRGARGGVLQTEVGVVERVSGGTKGQRLGGTVYQVLRDSKESSRV